MLRMGRACRDVLMKLACLCSCCVQAGDILQVFSACDVCNAGRTGAAVNLGCRTFENAKCCDDRLRHALPGTANLEVLVRPLRLSSPVPIVTAQLVNALVDAYITPDIVLGTAVSVDKWIASSSHLSAGTSRGPKVSLSVRVDKSLAEPVYGDTAFATTRNTCKTGKHHDQSNLCTHNTVRLQLCNTVEMRDQPDPSSLPTWCCNFVAKAATTRYFADAGSVCRSLQD